jgi:hypothetical protein
MMLVIATSVMPRVAQRVLMKRPRGLLHLALRRGVSSSARRGVGTQLNRVRGTQSALNALQRVVVFDSNYLEAQRGERVRHSKRPDALRPRESILLHRSSHVGDRFILRQRGCIGDFPATGGERPARAEDRTSYRSLAGRSFRRAYRRRASCSIGLSSSTTIAPSPGASEIRRCGLRERRRYAPQWRTRSQPRRFAHVRTISSAPYSSLAVIIHNKPRERQPLLPVMRIAQHFFARS